MIGYGCAIMLPLLGIMAPKKVSTKYTEEKNVWLKSVEHDK
jgi:hypothetical protein